MICDGFEESLLNINNNICRECNLKCGVYCDNRKLVVCKDEKSSAKTEYRLENSEKRFEVQKFNVDGAVISGEQTMKCDNLVLVKDQDAKAAIFIELKGHKISDAHEQLGQTMKLLKNSLFNFGCKKFYARVVTSNGKNRGVTKSVDRSPNYKSLISTLRIYNGSNYQISDYKDSKGYMQEECKNLM